jgi:hypothetical protein
MEVFLKVQLEEIFGFKFRRCQRRELEKFFQGTLQVHPLFINEVGLDFFIPEKDAPGKISLTRPTLHIAISLKNKVFLEKKDEIDEKSRC